MLDKLDVIIPTFNRWQELDITLRKLIAFGFNQNQIFIYNDSTNSETELKIRQYPEINYFKPSNPGNGVIKARNYLWKQTSRPYVLSLDDDSNPLSERDIKEAISVLNTDNKYGIFAFGLHESPHIPQIIPPNSGIRKLRLFTACGCIFKQEVIQKLKYYAWEPLFFHGEELDCSIRAYKAGYSVVTRDDLMVHHRVNWEKRNLKTWGRYGKIWRSANGFSANLIIALKHYPLGYDWIFITLYIIKRFWQYAIKKGHLIGFIAGIFRFIGFIPLTFRNINKLSHKEFKSWISQPCL